MLTPTLVGDDGDDAATLVQTPLMSFLADTEAPLHFNLLASSSQLEAAKEKVEKYKRGELSHVTEDEIWAAKHLVDSAYHPETGKRQLV